MLGRDRPTHRRDDAQHPLVRGGVVLSRTDDVDVQVAVGEVAEHTDVGHVVAVVEGPSHLVGHGGKVRERHRDVEPVGDAEGVEGLALSLAVAPEPRDRGGVGRNRGVGVVGEEQPVGVAAVFDLEQQQVRPLLLDRPREVVERHDGPHADIVDHLGRQ